MNNLPDVPNWLNWLLAGIVLVGTGISIFRWYWGRWGADLWAKRRRDTAMAQAEVLIREFDEVYALSDDDRRFQAISTEVTIDLIVFTICILAAGGVFFGALAMPSDTLPVLIAGCIILFVGGILNLLQAVDSRGSSPSFAG